LGIHAAVSTPRVHATNAPNEDAVALLGAAFFNLALASTPHHGQPTG
jgi:hypothetical protein